MKIREKLSPIYLPYYDGLCNLMSDQWQPYSGLRTFEEQDAIYAKGRSTTGTIVTQARGGESPHNYGCATDWTMWDDHGYPIWLPADSKLWDEYTTAIWKVGLRPGFDWGDNYHNEYSLNKYWKSVLPVYTQGGIDAAINYIQENKKDFLDK